MGLVEIVTEPDFHTAKEAFCFVEQLRNLLMDNGICVGIMHSLSSFVFLFFFIFVVTEGNLRVDVNISIGDDGTRTEIKNIGSLRAIETGIHSELQRQLQLINSGQRVSPETRGLDQDG